MSLSVGRIPIINSDLYAEVSEFIINIFDLIIRNQPAIRFSALREKCFQNRVGIKFLAKNK